MTGAKRATRKASAVSNQLDFNPRLPTNPIQPKPKMTPNTLLACIEASDVAEVLQSVTWDLGPGVYPELETQNAKLKTWNVEPGTWNAAIETNL